DWPDEEHSSAPPAPRPRSIHPLPVVPVAWQIFYQTTVWWYEELAPCLLQLFREGGHDFENVGHNAVIGDFKDRRVLILVHRNDGARALHPHHVLNGAADAERQVQLRRYRLPGTADLPFHG